MLLEHDMREVGTYCLLAKTNIGGQASFYGYARAEFRKNL
jgi:hypothetical protein